jgi:hypothetical protein
MARIRLPLIDRLRRWPVIRQVAAGDVEAGRESAADPRAMFQPQRRAARTR